MEAAVKQSPQSHSLQLSKHEQKAVRRWMLFIYLFVLLAEIVGAYIVVYKKDLSMGDAVSRTANAYYVLFLEPHKLASIGFVWNPLPSLVQLLILPFVRLWQPLASVGFAGCIATALFAAANSAVLFRYFRQAGLKSGAALLIVALYTFNPFVFYYGFNGMSETFFFTAIIVCTANFAMWLSDRRTGRLIAVGLMLAIAFLSRYETFALMLGFGFAMLIAIYLMKDRNSPFDPKPALMKWNYSVATGTVIFLPVLYTIAMWMFLNWTIMGNPFFFLQSAYSNESQSSSVLWSGFKDSVKNPLDALQYVNIRMLPFLPPFLVLTGERFATKRLFKADYLILVALVATMTGFHWVMLLNGKSFGWLRFYCFVFFFTMAWFPYELSNLKGSVKKATTIFLCLSLLVSAWMLPQYFQDPDLGKEEYLSLSGRDMNRNTEQRAIAAEINRKYSKSKILTDAFMTYSVIMNVEHPENLVTNIADDLFTLAVSNPQQQGIDYLVLPTNMVDENDPSKGYGGSGQLDAINGKHPRLYRTGAAWADLVFYIDGYKIYKVLHWDEQTAELLALVNEKLSDATLLFDHSTTGILHKNLKNPQNAIVLTSKDFEAALKKPQDYGVEYLVVPRLPVDESGSRDEVLLAFPELLEEGNNWTALVFENAKYRVYRVLSQDEAGSSPVAAGEDEPVRVP